MAARLSVVRREKLRAEVKRLLFRGALDGAAVEDLASRHQVSERCVWRARRWVLDYQSITNPIDRRREKLSTLYMLDSVTTSAAAAGKYRDAIAGLKLRTELLRLGDLEDGQQAVAGGARTVEELLEVIARGQDLAAGLRSARVHEDGEE